MQRVLRDRGSAYPVVLLCLAANGVSAVLMFLIAQAYWSTAVGLLVASLLLVCVWPYQLALFGGYHCVSQTCCLLSIYFLQEAGHVGGPFHWSWLWASGAAMGMMLFSSASSRKYAARLFSQPSKRLLPLPKPEIGSSYFPGYNTSTHFAPLLAPNDDTKKLPVENPLYRKQPVPLETQHFPTLPR